MPSKSLSEYIKSNTLIVPELQSDRFKEGKGLPVTGSADGSKLLKRGKYIGVTKGSLLKGY